ncbi:tyrosinase family protein [Paludibacterium paludis]|uniref:Tyrosinase copper-binding domain-containing protein n=1 Tax=Paludibacterium paludis TaxID=1225769 RepID=A0A918P5V7_9NEIS|nr:tyrosinase family protein [Paludibacterium paludis]GGY23302.1 hypothetical protein GCM10011289_28860 [Paludibacterium paludis]
MKIELLINDSADTRARYLGWAPSPCKVRLVNSPASKGPVDIVVASRTRAGGGQLVLFAAKTASPAKALNLSLPANGDPVTFFAAGEFGHPSAADHDVTLVITRHGSVLATMPVMVRIRKDATKLTAGERNRFIAALAKLNDKGHGLFKDFRDMHTQVSSPQAHGAPGFLPWHRAYLLDLERQLQLIDASVALPYWRFDQPAAALFTKDFLGESDTLGTVRFSASNPLQFWVTDGVPGIKRRPLFNVANQAANVQNDENATLAFGSAFAAFRELEGDPHGSAHVSFGGSISSIPTAAKDPLFFLLHANVDRLWAKWQKVNGRFDPAQADAFDSQLPAGNPVGHNLEDTMWPWNGVTGSPRPPTAPGGPMAASVCAAAPGPAPRVRDCLDYLGRVRAEARLGFGYDDVPYA